MCEFKKLLAILYIIMGVCMIYESDCFWAACIGIITILLGISIYKYFNKLVIYMDSDTNE